MSKRKLASPEYTLVFIMLFVAVKSSPWGGANRSVYSLVEPKCTGLWTKWPGHRSCFLFSEMIFPWQRAQANCKSKGGTLVSITSKDEQVYIEDHIKFLNRNYFWLGASKKLTKPLLKWEDGSSMSYQNWGAQESSPSSPSSPSSQEREGCLAIEVSTMTWTVLNCSMPVSHICKKSLDAFALKRSNGSDLIFLSTEQAITSSPQKVNNAAIQSDDRSCEAGWVAYNDFCYLVKKLTVNWFESYAACWMKQALLAVIETREENFFIQDNIPIGLGLEVWIGLLYNASQKVFENVDDSPVAFTNWRVNEPNNYSTNPESCVYMDSSLGKWYDGDCDLSKNGFVCKKPNGILSENPTTSADTDIDTSPHCSSDSVDNG
ncbi:secretory phospholipase A2 receptor-like [Physella acuta]|uniref:secretory phospholipase A2 receptor-like n=1 Tax=Physella acuta TaxID=109671 RepID=UPI0027DC2286|nr:secretory phospholipase A2 receptor-like [Physella acuta]